MPDPVLVELLRRGELTLVRSMVTDRVGLLRDDGGVPVAPAVTFDLGEWRWLFHCAVPVALRELAGIEAERTGPASAQATLVIDA